MSRPKTLLEDLCAHVLACGARSIEVKNKHGHDMVFMRKDETLVRVARFASSGHDARELREDLDAARKKPVKTAIGGQVWILNVTVYDSGGRDAFRVCIDPAPKLDPSAAPPFTKKQGQYLAFIYSYSKIHRIAPSEADFQNYFRTTPPSVHQMIKTLELAGFIERIPGQGRSIRLLVRPEHLPRLE
jgi:hypothetical protein